MNPLLDCHALPHFDRIDPADIEPALDRVLADHEAVVRHIVGSRPQRFDLAWMPLERADVAISAVWSVVSHLCGVADTPELRAAYAAGQARLIAHNSKVMQNEALYAVLADLRAADGFRHLADADRAVVDRALRDFRLAGVALPPADRARYAEIRLELSALSTAFGNAVLDATDAWFEHVEDEAMLAGIPAADRAMFAQEAHKRGLTGWVVTLHQPSVSAVLGFADSRALRERVYTASGTRASDQGPQAGRFDNSQRMSHILQLRAEAARLLGFADAAEWSLATKMAANPAQVLTFLRDLGDKARTAAQRDLDSLRAFAEQALGLESLEPWDIGIVAERLRQARYSVDEQEVRAYFPVDRVLAGWRMLLERLFGIHLVARPDIAVYHPDICYYDVLDEGGTVFAGVYLDLHARQGKRGGAWMAQARPRISDGAVQRGPVAYLVCNFAPLMEGSPCLLSHKDVQTLLHETGHCLHHLFTRVDRPDIAGTNGFEWDAIELPSQLMEDFAWDRDILTGMSGHHQTGETLPGALFDKLLAARHFLSGMALVRQIEFAQFDLLLHAGEPDDDPMRVIETVRKEVAVVRPPHWHRFPHAFTHIFSGGYVAGYYGYLWGEILAADGFQQFAEAGLLDRDTATLFREEVLSRGASRPAAVSFRAFRGRDADPQALMRRHGLA
ncbi:M3 family metallopeptidase [Sphingobium sp. HBC34]|uniref:oligopeptidase A n=1 Tax=Sphingobium cyanobacteriorum TaxID=3063954 RepID=A0ABT8ZM73_9SPHN|nr:M3 family metallopeptidase [Sphingobium sp. HBC34]MDO7835639.1 M3 family metallopeptidase [Sphingobium sp. HBC34]